MGLWREKGFKVIRREEALFEETNKDTLLFIIDRFEDPVTPLLNQWTYEAMVGVDEQGLYGKAQLSVVRLLFRALVGFGSHIKSSSSWKNHVLLGKSTR